jgi:hypothetical protein
MKKVILLAATAALVVLASCKQSGTCTCKSDGKTVSITKIEDQKHAKGYCNGKSTTVAVSSDDKTEYKPYECEWSK